MTALFDRDLINGGNSLPIADPQLRALVEEKAENAAADARFVYYLLASTGICVVPLSGFCSPHPGFRFTLLEADDRKREWTLRTVADAITQYIESGRSRGRSAT